jgi:flavin-dependent dehydrogenase
MEQVNKVYDFMVVGGGPAGSTTATYLRRLGYSVMLFEKTKFPRQHEGESLLPFCYPLFKELGVLDEMKKRFVRKPGVTFSKHDNSQSSTWWFKNVIPDESYLSFHVVRAQFDELLLNNSIKHGAEVLMETLVDEVKLDREDKIVEVTTIDNEGILTKRFCKFIVDASGQDTFLARKMGNKKNYEDLNRMALLTHWRNADYSKGLSNGLLHIIYLDEQRNGWFAVQPVGKNRVSVGLILDKQYVHNRRKEIMAEGMKEWQMELYLHEVRNCTVTKEILKDAHIMQKLLVVSDYSYYSEKSFGDNFALIGDSGKFLDPIFASGVYLAMNSAKLFCETIHAKLTQSEEVAMQKMDETFTKISGAYNVIEKFIKIFYDPQSFNLAEVNSNSESSYESYETAFSLIHFLLAGDFFNKYETYAKFLDMLKNPKQFQRWRSLVESRGELHIDRDELETIFGEIIGELVPDPPMPANSPAFQPA